MPATNIVRQSLRRAVIRNPSIFKVTNNALARNALPASSSLNSQVSYRPATTQSPSATNDAANSILAKQRLNRPISPNLGIYRAQITWYASGFNRITGSILSGGMYIFGAAYLVAPLLGWHLGSAAMAATFSAWPFLVKLSLKLFAAFPFTFHSLNGIRHLAWDLGVGFKNQEVIRTGWTVVGLSAVSALALALI